MGKDVWVNTGWSMWHGTFWALGNSAGLACPQTKPDVAVYFHQHVGVT